MDVTWTCSLVYTSDTNINTLSRLRIFPSIPSFFFYLGVLFMVHDCLRGFEVRASPDGLDQPREQLDSLATRPQRHPCARGTQPAGVEGEGPL